MPGGNRPVHAAHPDGRVRGIGSSRHLVVSADSATAAALAGMAAAGSARYVHLAGLAALLTGGLLLARAAWLGFLANFLSRTVLVGFLAGVGIQVAIAQLSDLLGMTVTSTRTPSRPGAFVVNDSPTQTQMVDRAGGRSQLRAAYDRHRNPARTALCHRAARQPAHRGPRRGGLRHRDHACRPAQPAARPFRPPERIRHRDPGRCGRRGARRPGRRRARHRGLGR
jgi:hypothetical protein